MAPKMDPDVKRLYARVYGRSDLGRSFGGVAVAVIIVFWALVGTFNYVFLARGIHDTQERALRAFAFGPAFVPLHAGRGGSTLTIAGRSVPVRKAAAITAFVPLGLCGLILFGNQDAQMRRERQRRLAKRYARAQGRLMPTEARKQLGLRGPGIPLGLVEGRPIGIPQGADAGHVAVIAPTRSGKGLHLTDTLLRWEGAAVVLDPKGEQWERTAGYRARFGPVFKLPFVGLDLLDYFDLHTSLDLQELHTHLLRTNQDREKIFGEKSLAIFRAAAIAGGVTDEHPLRLLAQWAEMAAPAALMAARVYARAEIDQFLDGDDPAEGLNRFTQSAWGTFTTRFAPYIPHLDTMTTPDIPATWAEDRATIYICYPLDQLEAASGLVAAVFAGLIKGQMRATQKLTTLYAIDEAATVGLYNLDTYLSTIGGYGATVLIYLQALSQLDQVYGQHRARTLLANCHQQVFYPPRDPTTARYISDMFGNELHWTQGESRSHSLNGGGRQGRSVTIQESIRPAFEAPMALPPSVVAVVMGRYRMLAERMNPIPMLDSLPPPPALMRRTRTRRVGKALPMEVPRGAAESGPPVVDLLLPPWSTAPLASAGESHVPQCDAPQRADEPLVVGEEGDKDYF